MSASDSYALWCFQGSNDKGISDQFDENGIRRKTVSATLYVRKTPRRAPGESLPDGLKFLLRRNFELSGGWSKLDISREYIQGLVHAGVEGSDKLLKIWDKHDGDIEFSLEY